MKRIEYQELNDGHKSLIRGLRTHMMKGFRESYRKNRLRDMEHVFARVSAAHPGGVDQWVLGVFQTAIEQGIADGVKIKTAYGEIKACAIFIRWQRQIQIEKKMTRLGWGFDEELVRWFKEKYAPDQRSAPRPKIEVVDDILLGVSAAENEHLKAKAARLGVSRQVILHQIIEQDMNQAYYLTGQKLLASNQKQIDKMKNEILDEVLRMLHRFFPERGNNK